MEFLKIFQGLISNDQTVRDDNLKNLLKLIRSLPKANPNELESRKLLFKRIWNSLFYCKSYLILDFWNTDKQHVQVNSANLICSLFDNCLHINLFLNACLEIFNSKWAKIDFLRLDKYKMLMDKIYAKFFTLKRVFNKPKIIKNVILSYKKLSLRINSNLKTIDVSYFYWIE